MTEQEYRKSLHEIYAYQTSMTDTTKEIELLKRIKKMRNYAIIGWALSEKGYTMQDLDSMSGFNILMLGDDFDRWLEKYKGGE